MYSMSSGPKISMSKKWVIVIPVVGYKVGIPTGKHFIQVTSTCCMQSSFECYVILYLTLNMLILVDFLAQFSLEETITSCCFSKGEQ